MSISILLIVLTYLCCLMVCVRDVREWLLTFPFPPVPIPIHAAVQLYITTVHYCMPYRKCTGVKYKSRLTAI